MSCPGFCQAVPAVLARLVPWQDFELVPLCRGNKGTSVPLSQKVALSHPVGSPNEIPSPSVKIQIIGGKVYMR